MLPSVISLLLCILQIWKVQAALLPQHQDIPQEYVQKPPKPASLGMMDDRFSKVNDPETVNVQQLLTTTWKDVGQSIETMQNRFFQVWLGTWPTAIDWTAAVMGTHVNGVLRSLTRSFGLQFDAPHENLSENFRSIENDINKYFTQAVTYFFGEDALAVRNQAFDDMLWIVLGWLENIRFTKLHTDGHNSLQGNYTWYGNQFTDGFAHRARIFYQLASNGWDTTACGGGMNWNPRLNPYKNAITNQLYISASINMYLHFPGDDNRSPYKKNEKREEKAYPPHAPEYLLKAITAYDWLRNSMMTNDQGLYIDGFHIKDGQCTIRNEMVYTYNQGVLLSGLRGLWESTGREEYLVDGHTLIQNTIAATGYSLENDPNSPPNRDDYKWVGLGRNGILEEQCDSKGECSQDGQTFKGILFHHLSSFCESLPSKPLIPGKTYFATPELMERHSRLCRRYGHWVTRNAVAAMMTRDEHGQYGMWWNAPNYLKLEDKVARFVVPDGAEDYRNKGFDNSSIWGKSWIVKPSRSVSKVESILVDLDSQLHGGMPETTAMKKRDLNDRGRGRTVETQSGGVAVVRAMWEFIFQHSATGYIPSVRTKNGPTVEGRGAKLELV